MHTKYRPFEPLAIKHRTWPDQSITHAPIWCSVDLRDGNQALINPMDASKKLRFWHLLLAMGYKEIEVGFPAASQTDFDFIRHIIEHDLIPDGVAIQVLSQCRDDLLTRTFEAIHGAKHVIVHIYNSTSPAQRRDVFGTDRAGVTAIAVAGARKVKALREALRETSPHTQVVYQYSPESFSQTEPDFAVDICARVLETFEATPQTPMILNLPATVEVSTPNHYADQIAWFIEHFAYREAAIISIHPHNDRGTAVAAAELALMAGAQRVEGTLFGNGERTGNVDLVTLGLNLLSQGVDPQIKFNDLPLIAKTTRYCTELDVGPRHPYAGGLVFTAFSGSHQDAIRKGLAARERANTQAWEVPYLPIDPSDVGGRYEEIIRINSQSGKGGVAFVMEQDHGLMLPRSLQAALAQKVQAQADAHSAEVSSDAVYEVFRRWFVDVGTPLAFQRYQTTETPTHEREITAHLLVNGAAVTLRGVGNGPLDAYYQALIAHLGAKLGGRKLTLANYAEHAVSATLDQNGSKAIAAAYVAIEDDDGTIFHGVGMTPSIVEASLVALTVAMNNVLATIKPLA